MHPKSLSGKFVLRLDPKDHAQLKKESLARNISLNQLVVHRIKKSSDQLMDLIGEKIRESFSDQVLGVVIFGSTVRGTATTNSDIDLMIILSSEIQIERELYRRWDSEIAEAPELKKFSPQFVHTPQDLNALSSLWLEVGLEGEIRYDKNNQIRQILSQIKERIASGFYLRKISYGQPYWVRREEKLAE